MKHLRAFSKEQKFRINLFIAALLFAIIIVAGAAEQSHKAFSSVEVQFTDASHSGLAIVPASCPSNPGDADAPYGCASFWFPACPDGSPAPNNTVSQCTCAQGYTPACLTCPNGSLAPNNTPSQCTCAQGNTNACARCPNGSLAPNNNTSQCTCLEGNIAACGTRCPDGSAAPNGNASQCTCAQGNAAACTSGPCPVGYVLNSAGACIFSGCPVGYTLQGSACIFGCAANQHAVGSLCVCNATNLLPDANGNCTAQACPSGFQFDPGTGQCVAINQCALSPICSDQTHALNQCTGAVTNCALNGAGWICQNGQCVESPPPLASITASPSIVSPQFPTTISWTSTNTTGCSVVGNNQDGPWSGTSGSHQTIPVVAQTIYTLRCDGFDGSSITKTVTINIIPVFNEQ